MIIDSNAGGFCTLPDPNIYGYSHLIIDNDTDEITDLGTTLTGYPKGSYSICGFSYVSASVDPATLVGTSYSSLIQDTELGVICADVETAPTCVVVAIAEECDTGNCPGFVDALALDNQLCQGELGEFEVLLTNTEKWVTSSETDAEWTFDDTGFSSGFGFFTIPSGNAAYFSGNNQLEDNASITSPVIDLEGYTDVTISVEINFQTNFGGDSFEVLFYNETTDSWDSQDVFTSDQPFCFFTTVCSQVITYTITNPDYLTSDFQIQFVYTDDGDFTDFGVGIDNVEIVDNTVADDNVIFLEDFEEGNENFMVTWSAPDGSAYTGSEAQIPLFLEGNLGNTCISEQKEVFFVVTCLDTNEIVEEGSVIVDVFPYAYRRHSLCIAR